MLLGAVVAPAAAAATGERRRRSATEPTSAAEPQATGGGGAAARRWARAPTSSPTIRCTTYEIQIAQADWDALVTDFYSMAQNDALGARHPSVSSARRIQVRRRGRDERDDPPQGSVVVARGGRSRRQPAQDAVRDLVQRGGPERALPRAAQARARHAAHRSVVSAPAADAHLSARARAAGPVREQRAPGHQRRLLRPVHEPRAPGQGVRPAPVPGRRLAATCGTAAGAWRRTRRPSSQPHPRLDAWWAVDDVGVADRDRRRGRGARRMGGRSDDRRLRRLLDRPPQLLPLRSSDARLAVDPARSRRDDRLGQRARRSALLLGPLHGVGRTVGALRGRRSAIPTLRERYVDGAPPRARGLRRREPAREAAIVRGADGGGGGRGSDPAVQRRGSRQRDRRRCGGAARARRLRRLLARVPRGAEPGMDADGDGHAVLLRLQRQRRRPRIRAPPRSAATGAIRAATAATSTAASRRDDGRAPGHP